MSKQRNILPFEKIKPPILIHEIRCRTFKKHCCVEALKESPKKNGSEIREKAYVTPNGAKPERNTATTIREVWNTKIHRFDFKSIDFST